MNYTDTDINLLKDSIITTIHMMCDKVNNPEHTQNLYPYNKLIKCTLDNLESIRDRFINEYNDSLKS
jgi:hypothetical protein